YPAARPRRGGALPPLFAPGRGDRSRPRGEAPRGRDRHRLGEVARVPYPGPGTPPPRAARHRALSLPNESARAGSAPRAQPIRRGVLRPRPRARDRHLRRRHAWLRAAEAPRDRKRDPHESRHAPPGDPALSRALGALLLESALRRRRRGAHLSGHLWLARGERAPQAAPNRAALRRRAALPSFLGDAPQSAGAG